MDDCEIPRSLPTVSDRLQELCAPHPSHRAWHASRPVPAPDRARRSGAHRPVPGLDFADPSRPAW
ncbi:hypothetical protein GCM10027568_19250 [Humibacter soli]